MESPSKNLSGLLLSVKTKESVILLTADHNSRQVWKRQYEVGKYTGKNTYIVIPHHDGKVGKSKITCASSDAKDAIISVGDNDYNHPCNDVVRQYEAAGFKIVHNTIKVGKDIELDIK